MCKHGSFLILLVASLAGGPANALADAQQTKWKELLGAPFKGEILP